MTKDQRPSRSGSDPSAFIWAGTLFVASAIIGACVFFALNRPQQTLAPPPAPAVVEKPAAVPVPAIAEQVMPVAPAEPVIATPAPAPAPVRDIALPPPLDNTPVKLDLARLAGTMKIEIPFLSVRNKMPLEHTCYRNNISPAAVWRGAPPGTKSFVVMMEKRTPPAEYPFTNWVLYNIPPTAKELPDAMPAEAVFPDGARHAKSDHENIGYVGPCEPQGQFTYALRVFALDTVLEFAVPPPKYALFRAMNGHIIDAAEQEFVHYLRY